ncbi:hypothetical protein [Oceanobacillus halotolerans]|uniref:hypothetical protein n=1 Tax=Oceanobacillus halotolerans TaxID=2663380 RepID=UPI0013DC5D8E|nr:hypothetical protein [Oceanobacillus halotolerans]
MMEFLYFPEDKTEYIPDILMLIVFVIGAAVVMYLFYKNSKKEAARIDKEYEHKLDHTQRDKKST